jgi:hypothetical protein
LVTCLIRYEINLDKITEFEHYARVWMRLIEKYGGTHHGYFLPGEIPPSAHFSFPGIGEPGADNVAVALFSFPDLHTYERYRREIAGDPECRAVTEHFEQTKCFTRYERTFLRAIGR